MLPPSCLKDTLHSLVKKCSMVTRDRKEPPSENSRDLFFFFSHSVVSASLRPYGLQHTWLPYPSPSPGAYSNSCPLSRWCHPTISSSVVPFSSCLQSFPASGSFPVSQLFTSGGQRLRMWSLQNAFTEPARNPCSEAESQAGCCYCSVTVMSDSATP